MNTLAPEHRDNSFVIGFLTGAIAGAGLTIWLAPRVSELGHRVTDSAKDLGEQAAERYRQATARVVDAVDELTTKGQDVRDDVAGAVARTAHKVERYATAAKSERGREVSTHSAADVEVSAPHMR
jgi:gas vesicle protein